MFTGFEDISKEELCREWFTIMETTTTTEDLTGSIRFLRICQELDARKLSPWKLGVTLMSTVTPPNYEHHLKID